MDEWRDTLAVSAVGVERVSSTELAFRLDDDLVGLEPTVRLARREQACCPFFDFALAIAAEAVTLTISVPEDAIAVLDSFAASVGPIGVS